MPEIPVREMPKVQSTGETPLVGMDAANAKYAGMQNLARGMGQVSGALQQQAEKLRKLDESAAASDIYLHSKDAGSKSEQFIAENPNDHEKWLDHAKEVWDQKRLIMEEKIASGNYSDEAVQKMRNRFDEMSGDQLHKISVSQTARGIELKATSIKLEAKDLYENGYFDEGDAKLKEIGLEDAEYEALAKSMRSEGVYQQAAGELDLMNTPDEFNKYIEMLQSREKDGTDTPDYAEYQGMADNSRKSLILLAQRKRDKAHRQVGLASQDVRLKISRGTATSRDIIRLYGLGASKAQVDELFNLFVDAGISEEDADGITAIMEEIHLVEGWRIWPDEWSAGDRSEEDWLKLARKINGLKALQSTKNMLMGEWIDAWHMDVKDGQVEFASGEVTLDETEQAVFNTLYDSYTILAKDTINPMPINSLGGMIKRQTLEFHDWYLKQEKPPTEAMITEKVNGYLTEAHGEAAMQMVENKVGGMFDLAPKPKEPVKPWKPEGVVNMYGQPID
jgi:hypothetical protein